MRKTVVSALVLLCLQGAGQAGSLPEVHRNTLQLATEIQGYPCEKGYSCLYADGHLKRCTLSREMPIGEARAPLGSIIVLRPDGTPDYVQFSRDTTVAGNTCSGGGLLGVAEGSSTAFYPSGKLKQCYLAGDQTVQGVPCMSGGFFADGLGGGAKFSESGKLQSCKLTQDYGTLRRGERFTQTP